MAQFRVYTANDSGAPTLNGLSGSLINVLTWCLVSGSGWLQSSASLNNGTIGIFQQPSGSGCILYVNDASPNVTPAGKEAWVTGWETLTTMDAPCGTGSGQFPRPEMLLTSGHYVARKSSAADATSRYWTMYADAYTFYLFTLSGDNNYRTLFFGDFFTYNPKIDTKHCFLWSKTFENDASTGAYESTDTISLLLNGTSNTYGAGNSASGTSPRTSGGRRNAVWLCKTGDWGKSSNSYVGAQFKPMIGIIPCPNPIDNKFYITPTYVWETGTYGGVLRGQYRGMYHITHPTANFIDGQVIDLDGDFTGKSIQIVKPGPNLGFWGIEISNTLRTNV